MKNGTQDDTGSVYYLIGGIRLSANISPSKDDEPPLKSPENKNVGLWRKKK